ncbi:MAG TPA: nucleotidyl transferase AbiEii/AbiGii toxin family protein [Myxococcota bacterium]|nr:nucleotidyl transferase AbiEii/AbiGii toxin family protein [Myxococcota bacterium]HNZ04094.1 nucleotidyl transferase AbiEii/AbiGii toxin family protein [Myxococcota bacterium]HOD07336.1 nucleotidyl transferase AbiEii/AbiGii toxin family protein [Myxococcota bacterium]HPB50231.1 nucleotidyl transferase AbiEii/AbiGii toxin family protein [Myxococcota bacterium]HQP95169.1 nucleotidyl transferase AbiEii/AbiGii toxin family protein [Myxococcota bacterium]
MPEKSACATDYNSDQLDLVRSTCLYVATKLGDLMDHLVVIGGLVPSLLINQDELPDGMDAHVGTMDLDVGLSLALLDENRYQDLSARLRQAGFVQDVNDDGNPTRQRWKIEQPRKITIDFLIEPTFPGDKGGTLRHIESDFAAVIAPGLHLAFRDREQIKLEGLTIKEERAARNIWVSGPGAFVVLKSIAFHNRGENKDAYDLYYVLQNYGERVDDVAARLVPLLDDSCTQEALKYLREDFLDIDGIGPRRAAEFMRGGQDFTIQADVVGFVRKLLQLCGW